jgi:putative oxidoreductase
LTEARRWAAIPLRLIVGYGFMAHGYAKLVRGPEHFIGILAALNVPAPRITGWATILIELLGGFAVLIGAFVPLVSIPMAATLIGAMLSVHLRYGFIAIKLQGVAAGEPQFGKPGYEVALLYLACLAALVLGGSGPGSVDGLRAKRAGVRRGAAAP